MDQIPPSTERSSRKASKVGVIVLVVGLIAWGLILSFGPRTSRIPDPQSTPSLTHTAPEPASTVTIGQVPRSGVRPHKNTSPVITVYVVDVKVPSRWGLTAVVNGWQKAFWTRLEYAKSCPKDEVCVVVKEDKTLKFPTAAQTLYSNYSKVINVNLNPGVKSPIEAQSTLCHEFGHTLGAPHVKGTVNTCMTPINAFYRVTPTRVDLRLVDSLGRWEIQKMYDESGKTVDARTQPK
jgi:hypothetical protein